MQIYKAYKSIKNIEILQKIWTKDLSCVFTKDEDIYKIIKFMKRCTTSLVNRKIPINTTIDTSLNEPEWKFKIEKRTK